jgi:hypothetical protein
MFTTSVDDVPSTLRILHILVLEATKQSPRGENELMKETELSRHQEADGVARKDKGIGGSFQFATAKSTLINAAQN